MNKENLTILVCSCDAYEDLWYPFFKLLKRYWPDCPYRIILNTESKAYSYEGLNIDCFKLYKSGKKVPYGKRIIEHLKKISTPYTLLLLDDFFIRKNVETKKIETIIGWLKENKQIACFSFDSIPDNNQISSKYKGFEKRPEVGHYKLNMQAAVWNTDILLKYWKPHESPWEWELFGNTRAFGNKHHFYTLTDIKDTPIDYGKRHDKPWGIVQGKWAVSDVEPLFRRNNILVNFKLRGEYNYEQNNTIYSNNFFKMSKRYLKSVGLLYYLKRYIYIYEGALKKRLNIKSNDLSYEEYLIKKSHKN